MESYSDDETAGAAPGSALAPALIARLLPQADAGSLTSALLAEAQLVEMEPLADDHRLAVGRIGQLARRIATVTRRFESVEGAAIG